MNLIDYVDIKRITLIPREASKRQTLKTLCQLSESHIESYDNFFDAILKRENILTTGIGYEFAFPHDKSINISKPFISIGVAPHGVEWNSLDDKPVKLIFLIGCPLAEQSLYLHILAKISSLLLKNIENRQNLLYSHNEDEFFNKLLALLG